MNFFSQSQDSNYNETWLSTRNWPSHTWVIHAPILWHSEVTTSEMFLDFTGRIGWSNSRLTSSNVLIYYTSDRLILHWLSVCLCLSLYLSVCFLLSVCMSLRVCLVVCLSVCLCVCVCLSVSVCLSVFMYVCLSDIQSCNFNWFRINWETRF